MKKILLSSLFAFCYLTNQAFGQVGTKTGTVKTVSIEGITLPNEYVSSIFRETQKGVIYIGAGCLCVTLPCTACDKPPIFFGVLKSDIVNMIKSNKKTQAGRVATVYKINSNAKVQTPVRTSLDSKNISTVKINATSSQGSPDQPPRGNNLFIKEVFDAFMIGWQIGTLIDEKTGASDKLSTWMLNTFGEW